MSSTQEQKNYWKEQYEKHKDKKHEYGKQYYNLNKETELERTKKWRELNPNKIKEYNKKSLIQQAEQVVCDICGCGSTRHHLNRHKKSIKCVPINN